MRKTISFLTLAVLTLVLRSSVFAQEQEQRFNYSSESLAVRSDQPSKTIILFPARTYLSPPPSPLLPQLRFPEAKDKPAQNPPKKSANKDSGSLTITNRSSFFILNFRDYFYSSTGGPVSKVGLGAFSSSLENAGSSNSPDSSDAWTSSLASENSALPPFPPFAELPPVSAETSTLFSTIAELLFSILMPPPEISVTFVFTTLITVALAHASPVIITPPLPPFPTFPPFPNPFASR